MRKLYEIFKVLQFQKRIVAAATIWGNTVYSLEGAIKVSKQPFSFSNNVYQSTGS